MELIKQIEKTEDMIDYYQKRIANGSGEGAKLDYYQSVYLTLTKNELYDN
jgi:hypothetical protein